MNKRSFPAIEMASMVLLSTVLFVELYRLNDWLFDELQYTQGVNWVFLPAGFRVILVLVMGVPGACGILLGNLWLDRADLVLDTALPILATAFVSGFGPWLVRWWMAQRGLIDAQLRRITSAHLLQFVLLYAVFNAVSHQFVHWLFGTTSTTPWVSVWPMFIGDAIGALLVLYAFKLVLLGWQRLHAHQS
jgi:hypothetical protein